MNDIIKYGLGLILYVFFQIFLFNELELFGMSVPYVFILFLLMLPMDLNRAYLYLIAFFLGFWIDVMTDGSITGLQAFSSVFIVAIRGTWARMLSSSNFRNPEELDFKSQSGFWYLGYLLPLIFVHQSLLFFMESLSVQHFFYKLLQIGLGTAFTFIICYILVILFYKR